MSTALICMKRKKIVQDRHKIGWDVELIVYYYKREIKIFSGNTIIIKMKTIIKMKLPIERALKEGRKGNSSAVKCSISVGKEKFLMRKKFKWN